MSLGGNGGGGLGSQYYSLRWNNHPINLVSVFTGLYQAESLVDVTLAAGGRHLQAHKVVLSACSEYFQSVFAANPCQHPVVILKDVAFDDLETVVKFMYLGHVNVSSDKLPAVLNTADALQIKGLEKTNELMAPYLRPEAGSSSRSSDRNLLSVPGPGLGRQPSTESTPEYLQRSRSDAGYYPHRAHSAESRGHSFESRLEVSRPKRVLTPPISPSHSHEHISGNFARKKFRNRSENASSSFSTSVEKSREESPGPASASKIEVSPSPRPDSEASSYHSHETEHIAKKKRAMFSANKGSSSCSSIQNSELGTSSVSSLPDKLRSIKSLSSSGKSKSHSSDRDETEALASGSNLSVPRVVRSASAEDISSVSALATKFKRKPFLKRQQCQEATEESEPPASSASTAPSRETPATPPPASVTTSSSSSCKLVKQHSHPLLSFSASGSLKEEPHDLAEREREALTVPTASVASTPGRQPSLDPLCGLESVSVLYSSPRLSPPPMFRPVLPTVRIIPDPEASPGPEAEPGHDPSLLPPAPAQQLSPVTSGAQLFPGHHHMPHHQQSLLHPEVSPYDHSPYHEKKPFHLIPRMTEEPDAASVQISANTPAVCGPGLGGYPPFPRHHLDPSMSPGVGPPQGFGPRTNSPGPGFGRTNIPHQRPYGEHAQPNDAPKPAQQGQFGHCPKARDGPALSCNFCWNTTDGSGRILRRKTKYHCPECQTNLCIVPCFQQYHEAMENENTEMR